jgi:hypothetical protein
MTWFKVDDRLPGSRKLLRIPRARRAAAIGIWTLAGAWCARELSNGEVPAELLVDIGGTAREAKDLVDSGLWEVTEGGWQFHDWFDYQPSREEVLRDRKAHADRQQAYRERKRAERDGNRDTSRGHNVTVDIDSSDADVTPAVTDARPDPSRPVPSIVPTELSSSRASQRGRRLPDDWNPTEEMLATARSRCPGVDLKIETEKFRNYWQSKAGKDATKLDWGKTWVNWILSAAERSPQRNGRSGYGKAGERKALY